MKTKMLGGILLIAGTCIGGGMLGLPIATAKGGIINSTLLFIGCWILMTFTALLTLEVNLCFPKNSNVISMAKATLGKPGAFVSWTIYLFFLYALVSAYIAGGQDVLHGLLLNIAGVEIPVWVCGILFVFAFGTVVIAGIKHVDIFNRLLMIVKLGAVFILMLLISMHIDPINYNQGKMQFLLPALTVAITSFGFSIIVPSLRTYFEDDIKTLRIAIIVGSFLPLICYIAWDAVIFGLVPLVGDFGLERLLDAHQPVSSLLESINYYVPTQNILIFSRAFTSICVLTAFACVSLGLYDYLADGMKTNENSNSKKLYVAVATFLPPLLIVMFYPKAFILFLSLAGLCCVILQALMPAMMAWNCRYVKNMEMSYQVFGGKITLSLAILMSLFVIGVAAYQLFI